MFEWLLVLKIPFMFLIGFACGKEDGVQVQYIAQGDFGKQRVNIVCEKPDLRMPVFGRKDE